MDFDILSKSAIDFLGESLECPSTVVWGCIDDQLVPRIHVELIGKNYDMHTIQMLEMSLFLNGLVPRVGKCFSSTWLGLEMIGLSPSAFLGVVALNTSYEDDSNFVSKGAKIFTSVPEEEMLMILKRIRVYLSAVIFKEDNGRTILCFDKLRTGRLPLSEFGTFPKPVVTAAQYN